MKKISLQKDEILVLRTSDENGRSYGDFQWPTKGNVEAPDWDGKPECGGGLHGLPRGCGDYSLMRWDEEATAQLVAVNASENYFEFDGKCKFKGGRVVFSKVGGLREAIDILSVAYPDVPAVGRTATAGDHGTATAGDHGTATAGDHGTATAGYAGTATAGYAGTATAGDHGTATAGDRGTATAGYAGTATAGYAGTATAGDTGTATAGDRGTATAGDRGTATAGYAGTIIIKWWDGKRFRVSTRYVGENGIEANKKYHLDDSGAFVAAEVES